MLHLAKEQVLPVPCLGTDEGTWVLLSHHAHTTPSFLLVGWDLVVICGEQHVPGLHPGVNFCCVVVSVIRLRGSKASWSSVRMHVFYLQQSSPNRSAVKESSGQVVNTMSWRWPTWHVLGNTRSKREGQTKDRCKMAVWKQWLDLLPCVCSSCNTQIFPLTRSL